MAAADELAGGSPAAAKRYLCLAERALASEDRLGRAQLLVGIVRLLIARWHGSLAAVTEQAQRLQDAAEAAETAQPGLGEELRALALISLGSTEFWMARFQEAVRHLEQGVALARRIGRPYLEFTGLVYQAALEFFRSVPSALEHSRQAAELAERHGWAEGPAFGLASMNVGTILAWQGRPEEGEPWMQQAERTLRAETEPADALAIRSCAECWRWARGRDADALAAFQAADQVAERLTEPNLMVHGNRSFLVQTLVRLGETDRAEQVLAALSDQDRDGGQMRLGLATLRLAQDDPQAAVAALAPVLDGSAQLPWPGWLAQAFLLEAIARAALGDPAPRAEPWSARWTWPNPTECCCGSCCTRCWICWRASRAPHRPRRPDRRDPRPARRSPARAVDRRAVAARRAAEPKRAAGTALPADQPDHAGNRRPAECLAQHRQSARAPLVRQARRPPPPEAVARARDLGLLAPGTR